MKMLKYLGIGIVVILLLAIAGQFMYQYATTPSYTLEEVTPIFQSELDSFTEVANRIGSEGPTSFCKYSGIYNVEGRTFDLKGGQFFTSSGPLGGGEKVSYEELLQNAHLTNGQFEFYRNFLDEHSFVECIDTTITGTFTAVEFHLPYLTKFDTSKSKQGFLYAFKGSPDAQRYNALENLEAPNWYVFYE